MNKLAYTLALAIASNYAYAAPAEKAAVPAEKAADAKLDVRKPTGDDIQKFWNNFGWDDLSADEKKLWVVLGWNGRGWGSETEPAPASDGTTWDRLSKEEQAAATTLGFDKKSWNRE
jgi:hypothetical protein